MLDPAVPVRKNAIGVQLWGPSGASIWSSPALDPERNRMYVTTGDNYSDPASLTSDAVVALDLRTGDVLWSKQFTPNDAWNAGCELEDDTNCPEARGPGTWISPPHTILRIMPDGRRIILAGQKSGVMHAIDPDRNGEILWQERVGKGGLVGGDSMGLGRGCQTGLRGPVRYWAASHTGFRHRLYDPASTAVLGAACSPLISKPASANGTYLRQAAGSEPSAVRPSRPRCPRCLGWSSPVPWIATCAPMRPTPERWCGITTPTRSMRAPTASRPAVAHLTAQGRTIVDGMLYVHSG